jgi:hypothetical protein
MVLAIAILNKHGQLYSLWLCTPQVPTIKQNFCHTYGALTWYKSLKLHHGKIYQHEPAHCGMVLVSLVAGLPVKRSVVLT